MDEVQKRFWRSGIKEATKSWTAEDITKFLGGEIQRIREEANMPDKPPIFLVNAKQYEILSKMTHQEFIDAFKLLFL